MAALNLPYKIQYAVNDIASETCDECSEKMFDSELMIAEMVQVNDNLKTSIDFDEFN
jgi:hypothetical protein